MNPKPACHIGIDALAAEVAAREAEACVLVGVLFGLVARRKEKEKEKERPKKLVVVPRGDEAMAWNIGDSELRDHVVQLEQEVQELRASLGEAKDHAREMERELNETKGALLDARAEVLKKELELAATGSQGDTNLDALRVDLDTARTHTADLESKMATLASNLRAARAKIEKERLVHRKQVLELEIAADDAQERAGELEARVKELEARVEELEAAEQRVAKLEPAAARVTALEGRIVELRVVEMRLAELEGAVVRAGELEALVGELEARRDALTLELERGRAKANADKLELVYDVHWLQAELADGVTGREELEQRLGRMDAELIMLRARIMDRDTELAGLTGQLHRAKLELEDAQEAAARVAELQSRLDELEVELKAKDDEAEESYDKLIEAMKKKKRLEARVVVLMRKINALQEKVVQLQSQTPAPQRPTPATSMSDPQLHVQTTGIEVGNRPRSAGGGLETSATPVLVPAPPGGPPVIGNPVLSRPPSTTTTLPPRPPSATVPPIDAMPKLQPRTASSSSILPRTPLPKMQRTASSSQLPAQGSSSSRQASANHPPVAGELRSSASPRSCAGSLEPRPGSPRMPSAETRQRSTSTRVPSGDPGRNTTPPTVPSLGSRRMSTQVADPVPSPRRPSVAAAAARTDVRGMAAALGSAPPPPQPPSSNPRKRPAPKDFDQSLVLGALPVPAPSSPQRTAHPPVSQGRGFTPKRSAAGHPLLAPPSPIAPRFGGDLTNNGNARDRERPALARSWLGKALAAPSGPQASSSVDSPGYGRVEAIRARFAR